MPEGRFVYWVSELSERRAKGFIPSAVFENDPGHHMSSMRAQNTGE